MSAAWKAFVLDGWRFPVGSGRTDPYPTRTLPNRPTRPRGLLLYLPGDPEPIRRPLVPVLIDDDLQRHRLDDELVLLDLI